MVNPKSICVYCGSQSGNDEKYLQAAEKLGKSMAENNIRLIYGGGGSGIMGQIARTVLENGGAVTGVIPEFLIDKERGELGFGNGELGDVIVTSNMHERKTKMFELSQGFIALPGGIGTLEEVVEILTWAQLGRHNYPIAFANIDGFWDPLLSLFDRMRDSGFIHTSKNLKPLIVDDAGQIINAMMNA